MRVLLATVCTPDDRKPLAAARALAAQGHVVCVASNRFWGQAGWSRFVSRRERCPDPADGQEAYIEALRAAAIRFGADVLLPLNDSTTVALSEGREALEGVVRMALPPHESLLVTRNKFETAQLANRLAIPTPPTWLADSQQALERIAGEVRYPCVAKLIQGAGAIGMRRADSPEELLKVKIGAGGRRGGVHDASAYVIQEWLQGDIEEVCALMSHGEPRAALVQRRRLMYPPGGGIGVWNETITRPELLEIAFTLLRELRWHGPAQVELLADPQGGAHLIEINGRFWGTLDLSINAGVDFPSLTCRLALDGDVAPGFEYRSGLGFRWPFPLGWLIACSSSRPAEALWPFVAPGGLAGRRYGVASTASDLRWSDPLPHIAEGIYGAGRGVRKLFAPLL